MEVAALQVRRMVFRKRERKMVLRALAVRTSAYGTRALSA
jgi:hypothetical protein